VRGFSLDALVVALGHAADDADDHLRAVPLDPADLAETAVDLVLGVLADAARVEQDQVGHPVVVGRGVALSAQLAENQLAVELVHLASHRFQVDPSVHAVPLVRGPSFRDRNSALLCLDRQGPMSACCWRMTPDRLF